MAALTRAATKCDEWCWPATPLPTALKAPATCAHPSRDSAAAAPPLAVPAPRPFAADSSADAGCARQCPPIPVVDSAAATNIPWAARCRTPGTGLGNPFLRDPPPPQNVPSVLERSHSSRPWSIAPPRRHPRGSVKDVPEHCVKDVMELDTRAAVPTCTLWFTALFRGSDCRCRWWVGAPGTLSTTRRRARSADLAR